MSIVVIYQGIFKINCYSVYLIIALFNLTEIRIQIKCYILQMINRNFDSLFSFFIRKK